jgi:hypothetical protein
VRVQCAAGATVESGGVGWVDLGHPASVWCYRRWLTSSIRSVISTVSGRDRFPLRRFVYCRCWWWIYRVCFEFEMKLLGIYTILRYATH